MNKGNIKKAIAVLKRHVVKGSPLDMSDYQQETGCGEAITVEENLCGTPCCFAGYVAVSPEFQEDGGWVDPVHGYPIIQNDRYLTRDGNYAIQHWLGISGKQAESLCWLFHEHLAYPDAELEGRQPTLQEVIEALESLLNTGKLPGEK